MPPRDRVYLKQGRWWDALREFEGAVQAAPGDVHAAKTLHRQALGTYGAAARAKGVKDRIKVRDAKFGDAAGG